MSAVEPIAMTFGRYSAPPINLSREDTDPPWADGQIPDPHLYVESEQFVAGALSTMPPFDRYHPAWCLPFARLALDALGQWEPSQ